MPASIARSEALSGKRVALRSPAQRRASAEAAEANERLATALAVANIATLETRNSDSLDFHELAVWTIRDMLQAAYDAGKAAR